MQQPCKKGFKNYSNKVNKTFIKYLNVNMCRSQAKGTTQGIGINISLTHCSHIVEFSQCIAKSHT